MTYGVVFSSAIPLRKDHSESSEMLTQVMFGDIVNIHETFGNWFKITNLFDNYVGWIDKKEVEVISQNEFNSIANYSKPFITNQIISYAKDIENNSYIIPAGSFLHNYNSFTKKFTINNKELALITEQDTLTQNKRETICLTAKKFINSTYLWGGKHALGIDCSGLSQISYKIAGINILRDASQQATLGKRLKSILDSENGDLAFFENHEGKITHVGIMLDNETIIHASGKVKIEKITEKGIINSKTGEYSHKLSFIRNLID